MLIQRDLFVVSMLPPAQLGYKLWGFQYPLTMSRYLQFIGGAADLPESFPTKLEVLRYLSLKASPTLGGSALFLTVARDLCGRYHELDYYDFSNLVRLVGLLCWWEAGWELGGGGV